MRISPSERGWSGGRDFVPVAQADADDCDRAPNEQQRLSGRERFSRTVQEMLRQSQNANFLSAQSSPASSDFTLTSGEYLSLPIQQFDDVNLTDGRERSTEAVNYYGPEAVDNNIALSPSSSTKAGKDIQVSVQSYPLALSPDGLCLDDRQLDLSYQGSEGSISKPTSGSLLYNYRPVPLRWQFLLAVLSSLLVFLALSQLALHLLPDASDVDEDLPVFQNVTEVRKRSDPYSGPAGDRWHFIRHGNHTESSVSTRIHSTTKDEGQPTSFTSPTPTSTTPVSTTQTSTIQSSNTETSSPTMSSSHHVHHSSTSQSSSNVQLPSSTPSSLSETESFSSSTVQSSPSADIPPSTQSSSTHSPSTQPSSTTQLPLSSQSSTPSTSSTRSTPPTQPSSPTQPTSTIQTSSSTQSSSSIQFPASTTPSFMTEIATITTQTQASTETQPTTELQPTTQTQPTTGTQPMETRTTTTFSETQPSDYPSTGEQSTVTPGSDNPNPDNQSSSTTGPVSTGQNQNLPKPGPDQTTTTLQGSGNHPLQTPTFADGPFPKPTTSSPATTPTGASETDDQPTNHSGDQSTDEQTDEEENQAQNHSESSSLILHDGESLVTSNEAHANNARPTKAISGVKIITSSEGLAHVTTSSPTQLPGIAEEHNSEDDKPFTTITMTQGMETSSWPATTVFTTSSSIAEGSFIEITITTTILGHIKIAEPLSDYMLTTTYGNGTVATISLKVHDMVLTTIDYDAAGHATQTQFKHVLRASQKTTLKNPYGFPTATLWYYDVESTATLFDNNHVATATVATLIPETPVTSTLYDVNGIPTKTTTLLQPIITDTKVVVVTSTPTSMPSSDNRLALKLRRTPDGMYFAGLMLPTLLAIFVFIPIRILNRNVRLYQSFQALVSDGGASAAKSLCLETTGPSSLLYGIWSLWHMQYILGLTSILVVLSALTIPLSTEAFSLILQGAQCRSVGSRQLECSVVLGIFPVYANVLSALLIVIILGLVTVAFLLRRWKTGVERNPWSILEMTQLSTHTDMQGILHRLHRRQKAGYEVNSAALANALQAKIFGIRGWEENGILKRGVRILLLEVGELAEKPVKKAGRSVTFADTGEVRRWRRPLCSSGESSPFFLLSWTGRLVMLSSLSALLITVLTYDIIVRGSEDPAAEITGKATTARFLFSGAGVLVVFAWGSFFNAVAFLSPYKVLRRKRLAKGNAININPATNPFTGLYVAFIPSRRDIYLGAVAATAIFSEFLPLFLGNIACNGVPVQRTETIFVYLSVTVLSVMILVVGWSFLINWPPMMGADPSTIAGAMYAAHHQTLKRFFDKEGFNIV